MWSKSHVHWRVVRVRQSGNGMLQRYHVRGKSHVHWRAVRVRQSGDKVLQRYHVRGKSDVYPWEDVRVR